VAFKQCKFCGCTEDRPCRIAFELDGSLAIGAGGLWNSRLNYVPCAWLLEDVCSAPACVDEAYAGARPLAETIAAADYDLAVGEALNEFLAGRAA
jgi:hypothetical protein